MQQLVGFLAHHVHVLHEGVDGAFRFGVGAAQRVLHGLRQGIDLRLEFFLQHAGRFAELGLHRVLLMFGKLQHALDALAQGLVILTQHLRLFGKVLQP